VVTTVVSGAVVTLTASIKAGATALTTGQVNFCDASAKYCTDIHLLGTAQLTSAGTATLKFRPGIGSHSYKAIFVGTNSTAVSSSAVSALVVTGAFSTSTTIVQSGSPGNYSLTATVTGLGNTPGMAAPTGTVSFLDTSFGDTVLGTASLGAGTAEMSFLSSSSIAMNNESNAIATADFNGDGIPDLAVSDSNSGKTTLTILLGNGDGTFTATTTSPTVGLYPDSIAVGDFNGDGIPDLAVTSVDNSIVTILLGNGDGTFKAAPNLILGSIPQSVATGDFNGDGIPDLAVVTADSIQIFLGNGDGTFNAGSASLPTGMSPITVAVGDFNGDGIVDLAVTNSCGNSYPCNNSNGTVMIFLGKGDGTFTQVSATPTVGPSPIGLVVADFNSDGILDLAVSNYDGDLDNAISILLGNGDGTFKQAVSYSAPGMNFKSLTVGDFNGDGIADIAVGEFWHGSLSVLLGVGDGTFAAGKAVSDSSGLGSGYLASADFNGDGIPDLAVPNQDGTVDILLVNPTQTVTATVNDISPIGSGTHQVEASYAGDSNYASSISGTVALTAAVATPVISPTTGVYTTTQTVTITDSTPGATIYYEAIGIVNTSGFVAYTGPITLPGSGSVYIYAYATETGYQQSQQASVTITQNLPPAVAPVISLASGSYTGAQTVTITDSMAGATIYYTTNGNTPTTSSAQYSGPITVSGTETLVASALANGYSMSLPAFAQYFIAGSSNSFIYTVAGDGEYGYSGDGGLATVADLNYPRGTAIDSAGNLYIADSDNQVIRKVAAGTGVITTVAGTGTAGYSGDNGPATSAQFYYPESVALDSSGNLYIADSGNNVIRMVTASTGVITTFAGSGVANCSGDNGPAISAGLDMPTGLAFDSQGNLYIVNQYCNRIRKVAAGTGTITTFAGTGGEGYSGDKGAAASALLWGPQGIAVDLAGNLYIADTYNNIVREVNAQTGIITTVAGTAPASTYGGYSNSGYSGDGGPATNAHLHSPEGVVVDSAGNFYIADNSNWVIRKVTASSGIITTVAGNGRFGAAYGGDGGPATDPSIYLPETVSVDGTGNLYITDNSSRVREVTVTSATPSTAAASPVFSVSSGSYVNSQTVTITDSTPRAAIYVTLNGTAPTTMAAGYHGPIQVTGSVTIQAIAVAPGYLPSAPVSAAYTITTPPTAVISTVAGNGTQGYPGAGMGGPATSAEIGSPQAVALDAAGNLYFSDSSNNVVWMVSASTGIISIVAGNGTPGYSGDNGLATNAQLEYISGLAVDSAGNLYISDNYDYVVRKVTASTGVITTIAGAQGRTCIGNTNYPSCQIGDGGLATSAALAYPTGLAVDSAGNLYIADGNHYVVRMISASTGIITTVAGNGNEAYSGDGGPATSASLYSVNSLAIDSAGNLYIGFVAGGRIRKVTASTGIITTVAGNGNPYGNSGDGGLATSAEIYPEWIAVDSFGNLYLSNWQNSVREVSASTGIITTVAGSGYYGYSGDGGSATVAEIYPLGIAVGASGNLYIADGNYRIREVTYPGPAPTPQISLPSGNYFGSQSVTISDSITGASIYYTTDGTAPSTASNLYSGAITVSASETLQAIAVAAGYTQSAAASSAYTISPIIAQTITFTDSLPATATYSANLTYPISATGGGSGNPVTFTVSGPATISSGTLTITSAGTVTITANQAASAGYAAATPATQSIQINLASNPVPVISSFSPAYTSAGGAAFTLTVTGSGFMANSTVYWGTSALTTTYGSATQLTAQVPAADIASAGITAVTVQTPSPGGGTSNALQFEVDSAGSGSTPPTFTTLTATVTAGSPASYPVTLPSSVESASVTCLNLPTGATCSYSASTNTLTITTSSTTPKGTYQITVVFTETVSGAATSWILLPILLIPLVFLRKRMAVRGAWITACLGTVLLAAAAYTAGCGGGGTTTTPPPPQTHQVVSSGSIGITIQ
jgi:sugar lactone lactonase YvrE